MNAGEAHAYLASLASEAHLTRTTLRLERITRLLSLLGNPHHDFQSIHVVGTAGKGSTATIAAELLRAHGKSVGLHVSPHLQVIHERMQVNGRLIDESTLARLVTLVAPLCAQVESELALGKPTYYETTLAIAFKHFAEQSIDYAVVEAGLGGRCDATNVLLPRVLAYTNVHLDHQRLLGSTVESIARDKAGAVKEGVPVCTAAEGHALDVLTQACSAHHAPLLVYGRDFSCHTIVCTERKTTFDMHIGDTTFPSLHTPLLGGHQAVNAALACASVSVALGGVRESAVRRALASVSIPCRFEIVQHSPLVVLDGAHNPAKMKALSRTLSLFPRPVRAVFAIAADKDAREMLSAILPRVREVTFTTIEGERLFWNPADLAQLAGRGTIEVSWKNAVKQAISLASRDDMVVVSGSFRLAGAARQWWVSNEEALSRGSLSLIAGRRVL